MPSFLRFDVYPVESFTRFSAFYDFNTATAAAIPLGIITFIVLIIERLFLRKKTFIFRTAGSEKRMVMVPLGKAKPFFMVAVSILVLILVIIPLCILLHKSVSVSAYTEAFIRSIDSIIRSLVYASVGATCLVVIGFFLGYLPCAQSHSPALCRRLDSHILVCFTRCSDRYRIVRFMEYAGDKFYIRINGDYHIWLYRSIYGTGRKDNGCNFLSRTTLNGRNGTNCWSRLVPKVIQDPDSDWQRGVWLPHGLSALYSV